MRSNDTPRPGDIATALALLTRLPVPANHSRGANAAWAWPIAGAIVAAIAGLVAMITMALSLPPVMAAILALATSAIVTGAMHEDGLADTADGLWGGWTRERRLEIMKDSAIGTYGVIALILGFGLRTAALTLLFEQGQIFTALIGAATLSRLPMVALSWRLPHARPSGLSSSTGQPGNRTFAFAAFTTLILTIPALGLATAAALIAVIATTLALGAIARAKIGGQTGDILGAGQQLGEIATLATLAALAA